MIDVLKDVDGFHPANIGCLWSGLDGLFPCTALGTVALLKTVHADLRGMHAVIVGRSNIVGKPVAGLLLREDCTVSCVHSHTKDLARITRQADILVVAIGKPEYIRAEHIRQGATVIDVGINRVIRQDGTSALVGDVAYAEVAPLAGAITPVPGGVGPMTVACLLYNTVKAACQQHRLPLPAFPV